MRVIIAAGANAFLVIYGLSLAQALTTRPSLPAAQQQLYDDINSNDAARVSQAADAIRAALLNQRKGIDPWSGMDHLLAAHKYAETDAIASDMQIIQAHADNGALLGKLMKDRALALLGEKKPEEALASAKSYFNVTTLGQTNDAINTVALCLALARPQQEGIARRFKQQQVAWAATQPAAATTQPGSTPSAGSPRSDARLGEPILPTIEIDSKPYDEAIDAIVPENPKDFTIKGNLLLIAGRAKEARQTFQQGYDVADGGNLVSATESVARPIRAESGCIGPANAYIISLREKADDH